MPNGMCWVGLDVHAHATTLAVFDDVTGEVITRRVAGFTCREGEIAKAPLELDQAGR